MKRTRILLADDHAVVRQGFKMILAVAGTVATYPPSDFDNQRIRWAGFGAPDGRECDFVTCLSLPR